MTDTRYRFYGRVRPEQAQKTPIVAYAPEAKEGDSPNVAVMRLYDPIDSWGEFWGVSAKEFVAALDELPDGVDEIQLHVNSPGGEVWEGIAILNALRKHSAKVVVTVDGIAASAASFIAMAGDEVVMARNSELMVHDAWGIVIGNAEDMSDMADKLGRISDNVASIYAERAGGDVADWREAMRAETWFSAAEAVEAGLADRVEAKPDTDDDAKNKFDLTIFSHAGRANAPQPVMPASKASAEPPKETPPPSEGADLMSDTVIKGLRERLGIADDVELDGEALLARLDEQLEAATAPTSAPQVPEGMVLVDEDTLNRLRGDAEAGRQALDRQQREDRERLVDQAVDAGQIAPARREAWLARMEADPAEAETLKQMPKGLIPVEPVGYTGGPEASSDDALYAAVYGSES